MLKGFLLCVYRAYWSSKLTALYSNQGRLIQRGPGPPSLRGPRQAMTQCVNNSSRSSIIGSKSLHCIHSGGSSMGFSVISPQTWTDLDKTRNISEGSWCGGAHSHKMQGKSAQGLHLRMPKRVLIFGTNTTRTFGHCTDFDRVHL